uniref:phage tail fiber protein n=1 Tax=Pectobacterium parmentieri TaxID=1905730 RepID=UPI0035C6EC4F
MAAARKIAGIAFDGTADIALTPENIGALPAVGGTLTGNLISTVADVLRMVYGGYGAILRQDGGGVYILLTNKNDSGGGFNSLRPLRIDLATGNIEFGHTANASVLQEKGQRVYSPNNKPAAADIGALPADGTAAAATKLSMARKIAGVAFDGTADIALTPANVGALPAAGTATAATKLAVSRNINGVAFDGTADITLTPANIGALPTAGTAVAATKLATARTINGVAFDGTANISLTPANVGALPTAGTAAAATKLATARTINGVAFDGTTNITITAAANGGTATTTTGNAGTATKLATARKINGVAFDGSADINLTPQNLGFGEVWFSARQRMILNEPIIIEHHISELNVDSCITDVMIVCIASIGAYSAGDVLMCPSALISIAGASRYLPLTAGVSKTHIQFNVPNRGFFGGDKLSGGGIVIGTQNELDNWAAVLKIINF